MDYRTGTAAFSKVHGVKDNDTSTKMLNATAEALDRLSKAKFVTRESLEGQAKPEFIPILVAGLNKEAFEAFDTARINTYESARAHWLALCEATEPPKPEVFAGYKLAELNEWNKRTLVVRSTLEAMKVLPVRK